MLLESDALRRTALILVLAGLLWNLVEAGVSLWVGVQAGSVAMLAFGLDSIVELLAGGVLVWRLRAERGRIGFRGRGKKGTKAAWVSASSSWRHIFSSIPGPTSWDGYLSHSQVLQASLLW